jgi:hypothetical protein
MNNAHVADLFVEQHVLQRSQADDVLHEANLNGKSLAQTMVDNGFVDENGFHQVIADSLGTEFVPLGHEEIPPESCASFRAASPDCIGHFR